MMLGILTYPYQSLDGKTQTIKDIIENKNDISKKLLEQINHDNYW